MTTRKMVMAAHSIVKLSGIGSVHNVRFFQTCATKLAVMAWWMLLQQVEQHCTISKTATMATGKNRMDARQHAQ
jgi:hypothetical protein